MRDGTKISADIYFPSKDGKIDFNKKYHVILIRTPYNKIPSLATFPFDIYCVATGMNYVFINNSVRGTYTSDGVFEPMQNEGWGEKKDGIDTIEWIIKQPWCSGKICTCGISYLGGAQLVLQLSGETPGLETSVITCLSVNSINGGWLYAEDFLDAGCILGWVLGATVDEQMIKLSEEEQKQVIKDKKLVCDDFTTDLFGETDKLIAQVNKMYKEFSLLEMPVARNFSFWKNWILNRDNPEFFKFNDTNSRSHKKKKPVLITGAWFDLFNHNSLHSYERFVADSDPNISKSHRLIVGPWGHLGIHPLFRQFPGSNTDFSKLIMEWSQQQLSDIKSDFFQKNPVSLYIMGENRWRSEQEWPLSDAIPTKYYLHSDGSANTFKGDGKLSKVKPTNNEKADHYLSDPSNPIPSISGHSLTGGSIDQIINESRNDILVYTSSTLEEDIEIIGYIKATIYASTSANDTDFFVKLIDVTPEGIAYNISQGGRRGRYLKKGRTSPMALIPENIEEWNIELKATGNVFKKGHKIRIEIASSDFCNRDINPNKFVDLKTATKKDYIIAQQTIYYDVDHPSMIELPIIPKEHKRAYIDWPFGNGEDSMNMQNAKFWTEENRPSPQKVYDGTLLKTIN